MTLKAKLRFLSAILRRPLSVSPSLSPSLPLILSSLLIPFISINYTPRKKQIKEKSTKLLELKKKKKDKRHSQADVSCEFLKSHPGIIRNNNSNDDNNNNTIREPES